MQITKKLKHNNDCIENFGSNIVQQKTLAVFETVKASMALSQNKRHILNRALALLLLHHQLEIN